MKRRMLYLIPLVIGALCWVAAQRGAWANAGRGLAPGDYRPAASVAWSEDGPPASGELRIAMLGTSLTARGRDWSGRVESQFRAGAVDLSLRRIGGVGENSAWGLQHFSEIPEDTDVVVIEFCMNDAALHRGMSPARSTANHESLIQMCRDRGMNPVLCTMSPATGWARLKRPWLASYQDIYRDLARRHSVPLLDTTPEWESAVAESGDGLIPDGTHPTDKAMSEVFAPRLARFLASIFRIEAGRDAGGSEQGGFGQE